ncbi:hypothetical protein PQQ75_08345 [Paraburkholderia aspalathi]|uniref:hypothetical protein n=1 Tax=Paraburkholderia aspalathi TaxID=1324617 RepID=UPI0038B9EC7C
MKPFYHAWVPAPVQESSDRMLFSTAGYSQAERECATRLVSDEAMEKFYRHPWFAQWNMSSEAGSISWKIWFNQAIVAAAVDHSARRDALEEQRDRVLRLSGLLSEAGDLLAEIEEAEADAPFSLPLELSDPFYLMDAAVADSEKVSDDDRGGYELYSQPLLQPIRRASGGAHFIPSVSEMLSALGVSLGHLDTQLADRKTIPWSRQSDRDIFESQKANDQRAYVRHFDRHMRLLRSEFKGSTPGEPAWRLPDSLLALQCQVALALPDLDGFVDRVRKQRLRPEDF